MIGENQVSVILEHGHPLLYTAFVAAGGMIGGSLIWKRAKQWPLSVQEKKTVFAMVLLGSIAGALLPAFFAGEWLTERALLSLIGPKTILGGLLGGFLLVACYKKLFRVDYDTSDAFAAGTALMMTIGRLGCHFGHCCFGRAAYGLPFGIEMGDGVPRIPAALIEALLLFGIYLLVRAVEKADVWRGRRLFLFFALYGVLRFFMEQLREPLGTPFLGLRIYEWLSLALFATGVFQILKRGRATHLVEEAA